VSTDTAWWVYIIECRGKRLYTGISNNVEARFEAHCAGRGARFTRAFPPERVVATAEFAGRSEASRAESAIKRLPATRKVAALAAMG